MSYLTDFHEARHWHFQVFTFHQNPVAPLTSSQRLAQAHWFAVRTASPCFTALTNLPTRTPPSPQGPGHSWMTTFTFWLDAQPDSDAKYSAAAGSLNSRVWSASATSVAPLKSQESHFPRLFI